MHVPECQAFLQHLADDLGLAWPDCVKRPLRLKLIRQRWRDPEPNHPRPNIRRSRQALSFQARKSSRRRPRTYWHDDTFDYSDMRIC
jgi:hypothetical protein